ncbi:FtsX-like permease family protein [Streptomyces yaizuensis]|uniref:FtsX-like permease family protein n=1 Tax=Streptomyces yaizuensis TaxID=2989713 RepID=A0ABQ5NUM3_9ACTN|nr:FtsX-like permease family protein [Streptomyces sp. YSPA8]GLF93696.1 FtsX-like permease family protein [Streptomyces sp. YSPA8]
MFRTNGLARAALRFKPSAFAGTFVGLLLTAAIVAACGIMLESGLRAFVPPQRYAGAPVVVAADQRAHLRVDNGEDGYDAYTELPDRARLDRSLVAKAAAVDGVARAVPDIAFPVRGERGGATGHGWASTAFTGTKLASGAAPRTGEVVVAAGGTRAGERITLETPGGKREFRVSGTAAGERGAVWFADADARALSGHPAKIDAIAVLPEPGTAAATVADRLTGVFGSGHDLPKVHTGDGRGGVEDRSLAAARETLIGIGGSFGGIAALVAVFTAAGTVALSVGLRRREFALLRAIGATPRQIRRSIATEALLIAPAAGALGCVPAMALASWWFGQLRDRGAIPAAVELHIGWLPPAVAIGAVVLTALGAGFMAARKPSRIRPGQALADAAVERVGFGLIRTPLGIAAVVGGTVLAGIAARTGGDDAANAALGVVMAFMLAVALLGPQIARACAALFGLPLRAAGPAASLAAANSRSNARRLASAITPIVLATAFSSVLLFLHTSTDRAAERQQRAGITADHVVSGTGGTLPVDAAERAAKLPGVRAAVSVLPATVLLHSHSGPDASLLRASAQGIDGRSTDLEQVQDPDVREGSLRSLGPGKVALAETVAESAGVTVGERLTFRLPDGTKSSADVIALYSRGLGLAEVTLPATALRAHLSTPYPATVLVRADAEAARGLAALGTVQDPADFATASTPDRELNAWANRTMAAILGGFAAVAAANTLVMTVLDRRRELGMLRLVGSTRRQVLGMIRWEALLVTVAGVALGTAIALATLIPMVKAMTGGSPYIPPELYGSLVLAVIALGVASAVLPARAATR